MLRHRQKVQPLANLSQGISLPTFDQDTFWLDFSVSWPWTFSVNMSIFSVIFSQAGRRNLQIETRHAIVSICRAWKWHEGDTDTVSSFIPINSITCSRRSTVDRFQGQYFTLFWNNLFSVSLTRAHRRNYPWLSRELALWEYFSSCSFHSTRILYLKAAFQKTKVDSLVCPYRTVVDCFYGLKSVIQMTCVCMTYVDPYFEIVVYP